MWSRLSLTTPAVRWCCVVWPSKRLVGVNGAKPWRSRFATCMQLVQFTGDEVISAVFPQYENRKIKPEETQRLQHKDKDVVRRKSALPAFVLVIGSNRTHHISYTTGVLTCSTGLMPCNECGCTLSHFSLSLVYALKESVCWSRFSR